MKTVWLRLSMFCGAMPFYLGAMIIGGILGAFIGAGKGSLWMDKRIMQVLDKVDKESEGGVDK